MPHLLTWPNVITLSRVAAAPLFVLCCGWAAQGTPSARWPAVLLFAGVVASDVLDGRLARRLGVSSVFGRFLDHGADIFFILFALGWVAAWGWVTVWLPAAIAWAFGLYAFDSWAAQRRTRAATPAAGQPPWAYGRHYELRGGRCGDGRTGPWAFPWCPALYGRLPSLP